MVMRLDLDADALFVVELHDAGVVLKDADAPIVLAQPLTDFARCGKDRLFEHVAELQVAGVVPIVNSAAQRLVRAVLAPGLGDRFQFDVGGITLQIDEVLADRPHFHQAEIQLALATEVGKLGIVHLADRDGRAAELIRVSQRNAVQRNRAPEHLLDRIIGQNAAGQFFEIRPLGTFVDPIFSARGDGLDRQPQFGQCSFCALSNVVGHTRFEQDIDQPRAIHRMGPALVGDRRRNLVYGHRFDHWVEQQLRGRRFDFAKAAIGLDQERPGRGDFCDRSRWKGFGLVQHAFGFAVDLVLRRPDFNFPKLHLINQSVVLLKITRSFRPIRFPRDRSRGPLH